MKKLFLVLLITALQLPAQNKENEKIAAFFWGNNDPYSKITEIPDKWKNESAVVIYKFEYFDFHKFGVNINYTFGKRMRIKLLDEASVKEYSEFTFTERFFSNKGYTLKQGTNTLGIKIVKPNGDEKIIDVNSEAVTSDNEKKIAIPNLEIGDIIDFYFHSVEPFKSPTEMGFDPIERTLGDEYPIMDFNLTFQTENDFYVNFNTYNGAPKLKEVKADKGGERKYQIIAKDIAKNEFPRWYYPLLELPCYKFQVFFARTAGYQSRAAAFLPESTKDIKSKVSKEDIFNYYNPKFKPNGDLGDIYDFLEGKQFASVEEKIREVYYFTRHFYFTRYVEAFVVKEANIFYPFDLYKNPVFFQNEEQFINHFMAFLKKEKIEYDIIIGTNRYNGEIADLLLRENVSILLRVNTTKPQFLQFFTPFTSADQFNFQLENTNAYLLEVSKGKKIIDAATIKLPVTSKEDNVSKSISKITLSEDLNHFKITRENSLFGHYKEDEQSSKLYFFDYIYEDYTKYKTEKLMDLVKNKNKRDQYQKELDALIAKTKENQKESFTSSVNSEFELEVENYVIDIKNSGRFGSREPLKFEESFTIKDHYIKKAGPNLMIELGRFLTSQIELTKKEKDRVDNIYMGYPRTIENEIQFTIPEGYTVSGLEKFNKKVENSTGGFISTAIQSGNTISIKTSKFYNNYYEPNSNWPKMIDFLDDAYQFSQEKILLKKI